MLTPQLLRKCVPGISQKAALLYAPILNDVTARYAINTPIRLAAFLAQVAHESASFHYTSEIASGEAYDNRADLGNDLLGAKRVAIALHSSTGRCFKGHGLIQITGYNNHLAYSKEVYGDDSRVVDPLLLTKPQDAAMSAGWYWSFKQLNKYADKNTYNSFVTITKRINGGVNGLMDRLLRWKQAKDGLGI